jgi:hypothetical protein
LLTDGEACDREVVVVELERNAWKRLVNALLLLMTVLFRQSVVVYLCVVQSCPVSQSSPHTPPDLQMNSPFKFDCLSNLIISTYFISIVCLTFSLFTFQFCLTLTSISTTLEGFWVLGFGVACIVAV